MDSPTNDGTRSLNEVDRAYYEWQLDVPGLGEAGQLALRDATALVTRVGGLGGPLALQLAAAGIGKLILAHAGDLRPSDLNRQILMRHAGLGAPRIEGAAATLAAFNPGVRVETVASNVNPENAAELVARADIVFDCAPRFTERFLLNAQCVAQEKALVDCAMYSTEGQVLSIVPGESACLACLYPETPPHWQRRFPVLGAVSGLIANIGALEGIKLLTGFAPAHVGQLIYVDTLAMTIDKIHVRRRPECDVCAVATGKPKQR